MSLFNSAISCLITYINSDISVDLSSNNVFRFATTCQPTVWTGQSLENNNTTYIVLVFEVLHLWNLCRGQFWLPFSRSQIWGWTLWHDCCWCRRWRVDVGIRQEIWIFSRISRRRQHGTRLSYRSPFGEVKQLETLWIWVASWRLAWAKKRERFYLTLLQDWPHSWLYERDNYCLFERNSRETRPITLQATNHQFLYRVLAIALALAIAIAIAFTIAIALAIAYRI